MARFKIISKDGSTVRYEGKPKYNGSYLKPAYLEFSEIASDFPIAWEVGDYVDYSRTGMRYRLYSVPQPSKNARRGTHGKAFTYSSVQLFSATKELEIALFRDIVSADNNIHFSSSPDVATFEDVYGIARRIEACMNDLYPGRWEIRVANFDEERDAEMIEKVNTAKDFFMSGGTCLDALSKIYELWQDIGWFHTEENGKEIITIGYSNRRIDENTASGYLYGKGNGLRAIKKNQTNREEFATRLYVYGSERNIPSRYYNSQDILNAESVDIRNLMIPKGEWGLTDGKRDARKAYLENAEAVQKYGIIPKVHYFDSDEAGADIYPSIGGMTIGRIRKALDDIGQTDYYPSYDRYPDDAERVDEILSVENPQDDGMIYKNGKKYLSSYESITSEWSIKANTDVLVSSCVFDLSEEAGPCELSFSSDHKVTLPDKKYSVVSATITIETAPVVTRMPLAQKTVEGILENGVWHINLPDLRVKYGDVKLDTYSFYVFLYVEADKEDASCAISPGKFSYGLTELKASEFKIRLKQIGFDISHQATIGKGCKVAVNTGACAGRDFVVTKCLSTSDGWELTAKRQQDDSLGYLFPNQDYQIAPGDRFVLIDIAMPDIYIKTAEDRLLSEGQKLLERASKIQNHYEPSIDAKVMHESGRSLREGMFMEITDEDVVDGATDYILIDTLGIYEDEDAIPTYKVTLKERRKVTYKGTPTAPSTESKSTSSDDSAGTQVDLSEYAKSVYVDDKIKTIAEELASMWTLDDDGNLVTEKQVVIKNNLIIHGDMASGGEGEDTPVEGVSEVVIDGMRYPAKDGVIDLTEAFANVEVDLSEYYTKNEVNELIDEVKAGDIDLANYYTKSEVDAKIPKKLSALENDLNLGSFAYKNALAVSDIPDLSGKYLPLTGGTITGNGQSLLVINRQDGNPVIQFQYKGAIRGLLGFDDEGTLFGVINGDMIPLVHLGNIREYALPLDGVMGDKPFLIETASNISLYAKERILLSSQVNVEIESDADVLLHATDEMLVSSDGVLQISSKATMVLLAAGEVHIDADGLFLNGSTVITSANSGQYGSRYIKNLGNPYTDNLFDYNDEYEGGVTMLSNTSGASVGNIGVDEVVLNIGPNRRMFGRFIYAAHTNPMLYFQTTNDSNSAWGNKKTIAFTDSDITGNAGSADRLAHSYSENINYGSYTSDLRLIRTNDGNGVSNGFPGDYFSGLSVLAGYTGWQMVTYGDSAYPNPHFRSIGGGGTWNAWKQLAFLTDNVASATKLATARTIWGQSFDGTGDVNGSIDLNASSSFHCGSNTNQWYSVYTMYLLAKSGSNLNIGANNSTHMLINSSGNVTIGASDLAGTSAKLYVDGIIRTTGNIYTTGELFLNHNKSIRMKGSDGTSYNVLFTLGTDLLIGYDSPSINFGASKMFINSSGNVTIGNSDYASNLARLYVSGKAVASSVRTEEIRLGQSLAGSSPYLNDWYYASICYEYEDAAPSTLKPAIVFKTMLDTYEEGSSIERMRINASGNVTIGGSDLAGTTRKLYVDGTLTATSGKFGNIHINEGSGTYTGYSTIETSNKGMLYINYYHNGGLNLCQGGGNVGIGTESPAYKLDVAGHIHSTKQTIDNVVSVNRNADSGAILNSALIAWKVQCYDSQVRFSVFKGDGTTTYNPLILTDSGNVLIGTTTDDGSGEKLQVNGNITSSAAYNTDRFFFAANSERSISMRAGTVSVGLYADKAGKWLIYLTDTGETIIPNPITIGGATTINGKVSASGGIDIPNGQQLAFLDASGNRHTIAWDSASNGILIDGNLIVLGELAIGLPMQEVPSIPEIGV